MDRTHCWYVQERKRCIRRNIILTIYFCAQSRRSFDPMITVDELDRYTFNIVPERDVVPMLDDKAQNYQSTCSEHNCAVLSRMQCLTHSQSPFLPALCYVAIRCQGEFSDVVGCHSPLRALCEIIYTCGSVGRPVICDCVETFGFPPPNLVGNTTMTFAEACAEAKAVRDLTSGEL